MINVELRIRALLRHEVVEFAKDVELPFTPFSWLSLRDVDTPEGEDGLQIEKVVWDLERGCFLCRVLDDTDASGSFGDDSTALKQSYESRGWKVFNEGPVTRVFIYDEPA